MSAGSPESADPAERALALAEQRADVGGHEARVVEGALEAAELRLGAQAVAVVEHLGAARRGSPPSPRSGPPSARRARCTYSSGSRRAQLDAPPPASSGSARSRCSGSWALVWSVTMSASKPIGEQRGERRRPRWPEPDRERRAARDFAARQRASASSRSVGLLVEVARSPGAARCASGSTSTQRATPPFMVTASGCAPPMPPSPAVSVIVPGQRAAVAPPRDLGEALVGALHDALACRCRSRSPRSSARTSSGPSSSSRRNSSQVAQSGTRFEFAISTRGAHSCVRNTPTGLPDWTSSVSSSSERAQRARRSRRRPPRSAPPGRCRRRRRGRRGARPPRGRGCSSASAAPPPAASPGRTARRRAARARSALTRAPRCARLDRAPSSAPDATSCSAAASSGASQRSGPGPATRSRSAGERGRGAGARLAAARAARGRGAAQTSSTARIRPRLATRGAQLARRAPAHRHVVLLHRARRQRVDARRRGQPPVLGHHRRLRVLGDHQPRVDARRRSARNGGSPCERVAVEQPVGAALGDRADLGHGDRQEVADEGERRAVEVAARLDPTVGQHHRVVDRRAQLDGGDPRRRARACRAPRRHLRRAAQRVGVLHARVAVAVAGHDRRAGSSSRRRLAALSGLTGLRAQRDQVRRRRRGRCRAAPRPTSPR